MKQSAFKAPASRRPEAQAPSKPAYHILRWGIPLLAATYFLIGVSPPFLGGGTLLNAATIHDIYRQFCHQIAERTFSVDGIAMAFCSRCTGFYGGLFLGTMLIAFRGRWKPLGLVVAIALTLPALVDFVCDLGGLTAFGNLVRLITGLIAAGGVVFYLFPRLLRACEG